MEEVPPVIVKWLNEDSKEYERGTVIDSTLHNYIVIPELGSVVSIVVDKNECIIVR